MPLRRRSNGRQTVLGSQRRAPIRHCDAGPGVPHQVGDVDPRAGAADDHHVGQAAADHLGRLGHRQQRRHVALGDRVVRAAGVVADADVAGRHVRQVLEHPQRIHLAHGQLATSARCRSLLVDPRLERLLELFQFAIEQPGGADHAEPLGVDRRLGQAGVLPGHLGRGGGELNLARHDLDALARLDELLRIEVADLAAPGREPAGGGQLREARTPLRRRRSRPTPARGRRRSARRCPCR